MQITVNGDKVVVMEPFPNSPTLTTRMRRGDIIYAVNGQKVSEMEPCKMGDPAACSVVVAEHLCGNKGTLVQVSVMRDAVAFSDYSVITVPAVRLSWLGEPRDNVCFIPVGANLPQPLLEQDHDVLHEPPAIAVYSITGGEPGDRETEQIVRSVRYAAETVGMLPFVLRPGDPSKAVSP